ncbi:23S rRNA (adenine(2503)-C(2))-methyltransferase RlmN [Candidatus Bipolaricaulota bacterium]|nr:23S rRNA (adenine(2503)-C(2))-methyltransferase RlmN [Candidatus Bipolaricaulota bacterium]
MWRNPFDLTYEELKGLLSGWGEPPYRARQLWAWLWRRLAADYREMTDLPSSLRERLARELPLLLPRPGALQLDAEEGTEKLLLHLPDGEAVETVLMREGKRRTVCVSTQVGCPVGCAFCATGRMGFVRNLSPGEIAGQVLHFARRLSRQGERVSHVVIMGMGEPLLNYQATLKAIRNLNHPAGFSLGARRFTLSTVGVVPGILRLAREGLQLNLAISLHAPDQRLREELVPLGSRWPIREVLAAADLYALATGRRVSFEYVLLSGVNDAPRQARALARLLSGRLAHVNLIPFNPAPGLPFRRPQESRVEAFRRELLRHGVDVTVRRSRGVRIQAGCGQLRTRPLG